MKSVSSFSDAEVYFAIRYLDPDLDNSHIADAVRYVNPGLPNREKRVEPAPLPAAQWIKVAVTMLASAVVMFCIAVLIY